MKKSESFLISALLSFSGGLQDAYTYNVRGKVFANAQTGNVVLMSQNILSGNWIQGLYYLCPLFSFVLGVFVSSMIEHSFRENSKIHWKQIILIFEIIVLFIVGLLPQNCNMLANVLVSFSCAMQVQSFRTVCGYGYASTMCIGNLRSGTESLSQYFLNKDKSSLNKTIYLFAIIFVFAIGAGIGGILSNIYSIKTIWISVLILLITTIMI